MLFIQHTSIYKMSFKRSKHDVAISMMASQIMNSVDFTKTQKSRYIENETSFFL